MQLVADTLIVKLVEVYVSPCIEQVIGGTAHYLVGILDFLDLIVIELVPIAIILGIRCIMSSLELSIVVRDTEKVID